MRHKKVWKDVGSCTAPVPCEPGHSSGAFAALSLGLCLSHIEVSCNALSRAQQRFRIWTDEFHREPCASLVRPSHAVPFRDTSIRVISESLVRFDRCQGDERRTFCGTFDYLAPEMVDNQPHDHRLDIWTLGETWCDWVPQLLVRSQALQASRLDVRFV